MLARCFRLDSSPLPGAVALIVLCLVLVPTVVTSAPQPVRKALDCNSQLIISIPATVMPGEMFPVTLTVVKGISTDVLDNPIAQEFKTISFFPSCTSTMPCMAPAAPLPVEFAGPVSTTCPVDYPWTITPPMSPGPQLDFTFTGGTSIADPNALTLPAAAGTSQCDLVFNVMVASDFTGDISMEATTMGLCRDADLNSSAEATADLTVVPDAPTLGETALIMLALLLVAGFWLVQRRGSAVSQA